MSPFSHEKRLETPNSTKHDYMIGTIDEEVGPI